VKNAVGFDQQRNDQLEIVNIPFDRQDLETDQNALDSMYMREFYMEIAKKIGLVLLALVVLMYFRKKSKRLFAALGKLIASTPMVTAPAPQQVVMAAEESEEEEPEIRVEPEKRKPRLVDQMQKTAKDRPEEIAKVIKTIMLD
jgi:flagellar biosynthesis/type III secretory pathway M-ring protein FliF/YscJ